MKYLIMLLLLVGSASALAGEPLRVTVKHRGESHDGHHLDDWHRPDWAILGSGGVSQYRYQRQRDARVIFAVSGLLHYGSYFDRGRDYSRHYRRHDDRHSHSHSHSHGHSHSHSHFDSCDHQSRGHRH